MDPCLCGCGFERDRERLWAGIGEVQYNNVDEVERRFFPRLVRSFFFVGEYEYVRTAHPEKWSDVARRNTPCLGCIRVFHSTFKSKSDLKNCSFLQSSNNTYKVIWKYSFTYLLYGTVVPY